MRTYLSFEYDHREDLPEGHTDEVRTPEVLVEHFLRAFTDPGDRVFDPFAGYGTTLAVAEDLGRIPYGLEFETDRVGIVRDRIDHADNVRRGDVLELDPSTFPECACAFTSPPFMEAEMKRNPFENYAGESTYGDYLDDVETAFSRVAAVLAPGGRLVVDVVNLKHDGRVTPLAWDVADRIGTALRFDGEVVVTWTAGEDDGAAADRTGTYGYGYDHSYCLVFENAEGSATGP